MMPRVRQRTESATSIFEFEINKTFNYILSIKAFNCILTSTSSCSLSLSLITCFILFMPFRTLVILIGSGMTSLLDLYISFSL